MAKYRLVKENIDPKAQKNIRANLPLMVQPMKELGKP